MLFGGSWGGGGGFGENRRVCPSVIRAGDCAGDLAVGPLQGHFDLYRPATRGGTSHQIACVARDIKAAGKTVTCAVEKQFAGVSACRFDR